MATLAGEVSVFADTNLGTRIALNVPEDITAGAFKRDFERVHFMCLPNSGKIQVNGLMVKRKLCFYYLPDSLPLKYVFHGMRSAWFLHVEASHSKNFCVLHLPEPAPTNHFEPQDFLNCNADDDKATGNSEDKTVHIVKEKKRRRKFNKKHLQNAASAMPEGCSCKLEERSTGKNYKSPVVMPENEVEIPVKPNANTMQGSPSKMSAEVLSVTGIIDKYFPTSNRIDNFSSPSFSDVTSSAVYEEVGNQPRAKNLETPPLNVSRSPLLHVNSVSGTSQDKRRESKLRKHLLSASQSLGVSPNKQSPTLSLCRFKDEKRSLQKSQTIGLLFDISDSDD
ncbi:hypothetical protein QN277_009994 [Acacia crassicarpa]|uniref:Uncharacterized protein n=1 Tax=Acacia crassicarpa TaxID=499986 RepID=A0AAE1IQF7_9FABA|nr:hypothetical protein QN277_009994 [Acacia crassicarpa]